ncbi:hypothetical protein TRFO_37710 [Tritrichomonas foetus]|uniref:Uncharacterized protein n=1 Tax=Tritrichomonas foetus TaxID=1144522 RepID=A0A1J4JAE9_9EUKA|nr:hypothetical protein TRFO_37710 [Tritrichomonas foetus]|eukprot:OHS96128.1 hypothetical protein TRFO_37710 [Tritrichomonas foetus]
MISSLFSKFENESIFPSNSFTLSFVLSFFFCASLMASLSTSVSGISVGIIARSRTSSGLSSSALTRSLRFLMSSSVFIRKALNFFTSYFKHLTSFFCDLVSVSVDCCCCCCCCCSKRSCVSVFNETNFSLRSLTSYLMHLISLVAFKTVSVISSKVSCDCS